MPQYCHLYYLRLCGLNEIFWKRRQVALECVEYKELEDLDLVSHSSDAIYSFDNNTHI